MIIKLLQIATLRCLLPHLFAQMDRILTSSCVSAIFIAVILTWLLTLFGVERNAPSCTQKCYSAMRAYYILIVVISLLIQTQSRTGWDSWKTKDGPYWRYCAEGPCGKAPTCPGTASGCRTDRPFIVPESKQPLKKTFGKQKFDIPVKCDVCDYKGIFQVYKN